MSDVLSYRKRDDSVAVSWSLPDLPTSLHKAGLAGLLCYVKRMPEFAAQAAVPILESATPLELRIRFTEESLRALMDSVYAGEKHLVESKTKWKNGDLKEERSEPSRLGDDKPPVKVWVYEIDRPKAELMVHWRHENPEDQWVVLWREAVRGVLRESRAAEIYTRTTKGESPTKKSKDLNRLWKDMVSAARGRRSLSGAVPVSMYIGAEDKSSERVDFRGEVQHNLLLHFWPFVSPIFVPRTLLREHGQWRIDTRSGYIVAVAEVGSVTEFSEMIDSYWRRQSVSSDDGRPRECEIDVAVEGGMAFLYSLMMNRLKNMDDGDFFDVVPQVDLYHLQKRRHGVRILVSDSIRVSAGTLRRYERVVDSRRDVLFRRLLMRNLLDGLPWHARASETLFARYPVGLFIYSAEKSPKIARNFGRSARELFTRERSNMNDRLNLAGKVFDIVGEFVTSRAEKRSGINRDQLPKTDDGRTDWTSRDRRFRDYLEAREKVATDAFLAIRGRNADEFVEYFVGSICAVPQFMGAKGIRPKEGFMEIAQALHDSEERRMEMKNLTMLALSAHGSSQRQSSHSGDTHSDTGGAK